MVDKYVLGTNKEQRDNTSPKYRNIRFYGKTKVMSSLNYIPHIRKATTHEGGGVNLWYHTVRTQDGLSH